MGTIEFPGLWGLKFNIDPVAIQLGNISIYWYGIIIATAFLAAVLLGMRQSKNFGIDSENIIDLVLFAAPVAIIFARLYYVIFSFENYKDEPSEIFKIWHGGLAIYGAVIGASIVAFLFARYKKINVFNLFDFAAPYLVLAQAIGRWGNFVNQEAFGGNTNLPWGMTGDQIKNQLSILKIQGVNVDPSLPVHPTFLYESLWNLGVFALLIWFRKRKKFNGEVFSLYMILYGIGRFWIEGLRTDSLMLSNFRISQVLSLVFIIGFAAFIIYSRRKASLKLEEQTEIGSSEYGNIINTLRNEENTRNTENIVNEKNIENEKNEENIENDVNEESEVDNTTADTTEDASTSESQCDSSDAGQGND